MRPAIHVVCELHVTTARPVPPEAFHARATALMDALMDLEECNADVTDSTVSSDSGEHLVTVELLIFTTEPLDAVEKAMSLVRTALHTAGENTANWPTIDRIENRTEKVGELVA